MRSRRRAGPCPLALALPALLGLVVDAQAGSRLFFTTPFPAASSWGWESLSKAFFAGSNKDSYIRQPRLCFAGPQDLGRPIPGSVQPALPLPGISAQDADQLKRRFPYTSLTKNCAVEAGALKYVPDDDCELTDFDPEEFLQIIKGRRVVLWGDSVTLQFFTYLTIRLEKFRTRKPTDWGEHDTNKYPPADPENCNSHSEVEDGLRLDESCFDIWKGTLEELNVCHQYHDSVTSLCFVRADQELINENNVVYWNALRETDVVVANVALHYNKMSSFQKELSVIAGTLKYLSTRQKLPLMLWREASAQHFPNGQGGYYPKGNGLRSVNPETFECRAYPYRFMKDLDWRNNVVREEGFVAKDLKVTLPILPIWNTTAMASHLHPQLLSHLMTKEAAIADCTHFCPAYGGIYEMWGTLLQNFLNAASPLDEHLKVQIHGQDNLNPRRIWKQENRAHRDRYNQLKREIRAGTLATTVDEDEFQETSESTSDDQ